MERKREMRLAASGEFEGKDGSEGGTKGRHGECVGGDDWNNGAM